MPASASAIHFVDPIAGTDDATHGGAYGACGYKTITYALAHTTGPLELQTATYTAATETFPLILVGQQKLLCNSGNTGRATIRGMGHYQPTGYNTSIVLAGNNNAIAGCIVDGGKPTSGICVDVASSGMDTSSNVIQQSDIGNCTGTAILLGTDVKYLNVLGNTIHDSLAGVAWGSTSPNGSVGLMNGNTFTGNSVGISCYDGTGNVASPMVTGSGNTYVANGTNCSQCVHCPF